MTAPAMAKMAGYQKRPVEINNTLISLWMNKAGEAKTKAQELAATYPEDDLVAAVSASLAVLERKPQRTVEAIREGLDKRPGSLHLAFALSQVLAEQNDLKGAREALVPAFQRQVRASKLQPGLVNLLVSLTDRQGDAELALGTLEEAHMAWSSSRTDVVGSRTVFFSGHPLM